MLVNTIRKLCKIEYILFTLLCVVSLFVYSKDMTDIYIVPKWCYTTLFFVLGVIVLSVKILFNRNLYSNILIMSCIVVIACTAQAIYGIIEGHQAYPDSNYGITGSFDNPAGFAASISIGFPFILLFMKNVKLKVWIVTMYLLIFLFIFVIIVSESRSGILSISAIIVFELYSYLRIKRKFKVIIISTFFLLLLVGSYFLKKDSADGRLFVWKCTWEMIKDSPIYGHGIDAFRTHYMDYQADYLMRHPNSEYAMLADNVLSPFNEYLRIVINFGVLGLIIMSLGILFLIFHYYKRHKEEKRIALLSLLSLGIFSMFSYPLTYPFVWIIICFDIYIVLKGSLNFTISFFAKKVLCIVILIGGIGALYKLYQRIDAEYRWNNIAYFYTDANMKIYTELIPILGDNPYFLYNYANALLDNDKLDTSLDMALKCRNYWADYDLELLLGSIYKRKNVYDLAEFHYKKASFMCPSRFIPLYELYVLYKEMNATERAKLMAQQILDKPIKIQSEKINQIKNIMKKELRIE